MIGQFGGQKQRRGNELLACGIILGALLLAGCRPPGAPGSRGSQSDKESEEPTTPVEVHAVEQGPIESVVKANSELEAKSKIQVFSKTANYVAELLVEDGDLVEEGDVLLLLESDVQTTQFNRAKVRLETLEKDYKRQQALFAEELISDQAFADFETQLKEQRLAFDDAQRELAYTEVQAKISGTVSERMVNLGDNVSVGQHLFTIVDFQSLVARLFLPEMDLGLIEIDQIARLTAPAFGEQVFSAYVKRIAPIVDPQTGLVKVTLGLREYGGLRPGNVVNAEVVIDTSPTAVLAPKAALVYDGEQSYVFRLKPDTEPPNRRIERLSVEPRLDNKEFLEPVSGIEIGDQLVVAGKVGLTDNGRVRLPGDPKPEPKETPEKKKKRFGFGGKPKKEQPEDSDEEESDPSEESEDSESE